VKLEALELLESCVSQGRPTAEFSNRIVGRRGPLQNLPLWDISAL